LALLGFDIFAELGHTLTSLGETFMQTVTISLSDDLVIAANMSKDEIVTGMSREYAMKLFREGKFTLKQSADFCQMDIYDFTSLLSKAGIPVIDYDPAELELEIAEV
jgi:predicted HTH domain antitoxin